MTVFDLELSPRDPVISRDGRPFGADSGRRMKSLAWPTPSVTAGSLRSLLGKLAGWSFTPSEQEALLRLSFQGPFPRVAWDASEPATLLLPAPQDCIAYWTDGKHVPCAARPQKLDGELDGTDLPYGLWPLMHLPAGQGKSVGVPAWWSLAAIEQWLLAAQGVPPDWFSDANCCHAAVRDERVHVQIDPQTYAAADGLLFSTTGLVLDRLWKFDTSPGKDAQEGVDTNLGVRVNCPADADPKLLEVLSTLDELHPLGGERRLMHFRRATAPAETGFECPTALRQKLADLDSTTGFKGVRLVLASPGIFSEGWHPGWLQPSGDGTLVGQPFSGGPHLKLRGVQIERWQAISGWCYKSWKPKAIRRAVPAGGVYFFEVVDGCAGVLADHWLQPIERRSPGDSADPSTGDTCQDSRDGFNLGLWGIWNDHTKESEAT